MKIDVTDLGAVVGPDVTALESHPHAEQVAARRVELVNLVEEEPGEGGDERLTGDDQQRQLDHFQPSRDEVRRVDQHADRHEEQHRERFAADVMACNRDCVPEPQWVALAGILTTDPGPQSKTCSSTCSFTRPFMIMKI